jgi:hypothetical protein
MGKSHTWCSKQRSKLGSTLATKSYFQPNGLIAPISPC